MRFASLGSGSEGNGLIVECGETRVLVDCGFKLKETIRRLARLGLEPCDLAAVLVTHEHDDHGGGVARLARRYDLPVYLTYGTLVALGPRSSMMPRVSVIDSHTPFLIGDLEIHPYPVPHDAREPSQFVFSDGDRRLGLLTDTGDSTPHIQRMLSGIDALVLECNHDLDLLMNGPYPAITEAANLRPAGASRQRDGCAHRGGDRLQPPSALHCCAPFCAEQHPGACSCSHVRCLEM